MNFVIQRTLMFVVAICAGGVLYGMEPAMVRFVSEEGDVCFDIPIEAARLSGEAVMHIRLSTDGQLPRIRCECLPHTLSVVVECLQQAYGHQGEERELPSLLAARLPHDSHQKSEVFALAKRLRIPVIIRALEYAAQQKQDQSTK